MGAPFDITTAGVDAEIAAIPGPQLVVPITSARFALNAANARWGSLYDAVYGTDVLGDVSPPGPYDPVRGSRVMAWAKAFLDDVVPIEGTSHIDVASCTVRDGHLAIATAAGTDHSLADVLHFAGHAGSADAPTAVLLVKNGLHIEIQVDRDNLIGSSDAAGVADVVLEAAVTTIMDCEDSVATVDAFDTALAYGNWFGLIQRTLTEKVSKDGHTFTRSLEPNRTYTGPDGAPLVLSGRSLMLVRNVGHLMTTPAVLDADGNPAFEGLLDAMTTVHAPWSTSTATRRTQHLVPCTSSSRRCTDHARSRSRTTSSLSSRIAFIDAGFLDRTGDEIHTSMEAGPMVRKNAMESQRWMTAYEDWNVDTGLACGLQGKAQIGKDMWAAPDLMADMVGEKIAHPEAGANCAWVPSPTAATLHATHYHRVDVLQRQAELRRRLDSSGPRATMEDDLLTIPVDGDRSWTDDEIQQELDNNAHGVLGYVVRWVDQGVGCSKVPDITDVALMEDRATCPDLVATHGELAPPRDRRRGPHHGNDAAYGSRRRPTERG